MKGQNFPPWWGGSEYKIGDKPSQYVAGAGREFLSQHLNGRARNLTSFGCWTGRNVPVLLDLAGLNGQVICIDGPWAERAVDILRKRHPMVRVVEAKLTGLSTISDRSVSGGLCWRVLHNLTSSGALGEALSEINRVLIHTAPLVVAVRASQKHTANTSPVLVKTTNPGGSREDLYFTRPSLETTFRRAGFQILHAEEVLEGEEVGGHVVMNRYWAVHLLKR